MQSEGGGGVAAVVCTFGGKKGFCRTHAHTHTHTDGFLQRQTKATEDGWLWNKQLHNVFVLRKQVLFNKRANVCLSV